MPRQDSRYPFSSLGHTFRLNIIGLREMRVALGRFADLINDFGPLWERYVRIMTEVELEWFASKGHGTWPPLALSTLAQKERKGYPSDPLIRTGALFESLTNPADAAEIGQGHTSLGTFDVNSLSWGTDEETAEYHWTGRTHPNFMPRRPPIEWPPSPATLARFEEANRDFVEQRLRESGLEER